MNHISLYKDERLAVSVDPVDTRGLQYVEVARITAKVTEIRTKVVTQKFKIVINSDYQRPKNSAEIFLWTSNTWRSVYKIPPAMMRTPEDLREAFYRDEISINTILEKYTEDRDELVKIVLNICFD